MQIHLSGTEWAVLECLWEEAPLTLMQLVNKLKQSVGWAKSTTSTMVRRMEEKELIYSRPNGRGKDFYPNVDRRIAVAQETKRFLDRVYQGSVRLMMSAMAKQQQLTQEEIEDLYAILKEAEVKEP